MIYLPNTTDLIQITTSSAATTHVNCNYIDAAAATLVPSAAGRQNTAIAGAATTTVLAAPGASTTRTLKQMTVRNYDTTLSCDVTVIYDANGTDYQLHKVTLRPGEALEYIEGVGFFTLVPAPALDVLKIMASDSVHATAATFADITGMTQPLLSGIKYAVQACLLHTNNASTTGSSFGYNIGAAPTLAVFGDFTTSTNAAVTGVIAAGSGTARDTAFIAQTTGQTAIGMTLVSGMVQPSADGTFALRAFSEVSVAAGLTVKAGSWMWIGQER